MSAREIVERHRRHVEQSPGVGADVQRYALAVLDDVLADLLSAAREAEPDVLADGEWCDGVAIRESGSVAFESPNWREKHFFDPMRAALAWVYCKSKRHRMPSGHVCEYRSALQSIHDSAHRALKRRRVQPEGEQ